MIRIKDYIFNEKEIKYIKTGISFTNTFGKTDSLNIRTKEKDLLIENATFEDIEWNYGVTLKILSEEEQIKQFRENDKDKILKLRNDLIDKLQNKNKELEEENKELQQTKDKAIEYIKKHKSTNPHLTSLLVDSEITELEKILKGEENDN